MGGRAAQAEAAARERACLPGGCPAPHPPTGLRCGHRLGPESGERACLPGRGPGAQAGEILPLPPAPHPTGLRGGHQRGPELREHPSPGPRCPAAGAPGSLAGHSSWHSHVAARLSRNSGCPGRLSRTPGLVGRARGCPAAPGSRAPRGASPGTEGRGLRNAPPAASGLGHGTGERGRPAPPRAWQRRRAPPGGACSRLSGCYGDGAIETPAESVSDPRLRPPAESPGAEPPVSRADKSDRTPALPPKPGRPLRPIQPDGGGVGGGAPRSHGSQKSHAAPSGIRPPPVTDPPGTAREPRPHGVPGTCWAPVGLAPPPPTGTGSQAGAAGTLRVARLGRRGSGVRNP